jgi:hypothetical protein
MEELEEVTAVVGFGLAGGLVKSGERGDLLIPTTIGWNSAKELPTEWLRMALAAGARGRIWRELITIPELISSKAEKSALFAATDAEGVDMESGAWGALCRERKVPWAVVRSILDPAHETLPPELLQIPDRFGRSSLARAVPHFLKNPGLIRQAWDVSGDRLARSTAPMTDLLVSWLRTGA